jgi:hypothetical protein
MTNMSALKNMEIHKNLKKELDKIFSRLILKTIKCYFTLYVSWMNNEDEKKGSKGN